MNLIKNIYNAENTYGDFFHYPIKQINTKFNHIIEGQGIIPSITLRVIQVVINLFISTPLFIMGTIVKLCDLPFIHYHNHKTKKEIISTLLSESQYSNSFLMLMEGWHLKETHRTGTNLDYNPDTIRDGLLSDINKHTNVFQRVYCDIFFDRTKEIKTTLINGKVITDETIIIGKTRTITLSIYERNTQGLPN